LVTDDSGRPLGLSTNHSGFSGRNDFGGVKNQNPFPQVSEAARNSKPGYSWPPHLYQELKNWYSPLYQKFEYPPKNAAYFEFHRGESGLTVSPNASRTTVQFAWWQATHLILHYPNSRIVSNQHERGTPSRYARTYFQYSFILMRDAISSTSRAVF